MKKRLILVGIIGFGVLFGCSQVTQDVSAIGVNQFELVSTDNHKGDTLYTYKHKQTGCYYLTNKNGYSGGMVQMFIEKDGESIPYCDK